MNISPIIWICLLVAAGFGSGWMTHGWKADAEKAADVQQAAKDQFRRLEHADVAASAHEDFKQAATARERIVIKEVLRVVEKPVYLNRCFDADGLRVLAQDIASRTHPGQPAPSMPNPAGTESDDRQGGVPVESQPDPSLQRVR